MLRREACRKGATAQIYYNLAKVLEQVGKWQQAGQWLRRAVLKDPTYAIAWFELGRWQLDQRALRAAYGAFKTAFELNQQDHDAKRNAARLALRLGDWNQAQLLWQAFDDQEASLARYRIGAELGETEPGTIDALLSDKCHRPETWKALTRTARGSLPLSLTD